MSLWTRCWVENVKLLRVKSDLTERLKLRFDQEGTTIPFPQRLLHIESESISFGIQNGFIEPKEVDES